MIPIPSWADSRYLGALTDYDTTKVTISGNGQQVFLPAFPNRWAVGFSFPQAIPVGATIGPHNLLAVAPFLLASANLQQWYTIFNYGPLPTVQWYALNCDTLVFLVHELSIKLPGVPNVQLEESPPLP